MNQKEVMENKEQIKEIEDDKALVEALLSESVLIDFNKKQQETPSYYFERFPDDLLMKIKAQQKPVPVFHIGKMAVAAAVIFLVATTYFFIEKSNQNLQKESIALHEIPTAELDSYVNNNEWVAEAELQNEINNLGINFESNNLSKDSSN